MVGTPRQTTSYCWNGTIGGYNNIGKSPPFTDGKTYKISDFLATDWQMWEQNELDSLNFNDAANVSAPGNVGNGISIRHAGSAGWSSLNNPNGATTAKSSGGAMVGTFGGGAGLCEVE